MPIDKSISKVQKKIRGKEKSLHPRSLKLQQLTRATLRKDKLDHDRSQRNSIKEVLLERWKFFKTAVTMAESESYDVDAIHELIKLYVSRSDQDLAALKAQRRAGRPPSAKQLSLEHRIEQETQEYKTGFKIPDLTDRESVKELKIWNETVGGLTVVKFIRVSQDSNDTCRA